MHLSNTKKAILALIIANIIWGAASPIFKWSLLNIQPFTLAFLRFIIPMFLIGFLYRKSLKIDKEDYKSVFILGFTGITINIFFFFLALQDTKSINAPVIGSSAPIMLMIGSFFILKEKLKMKVIFGNLIAFAGIMAIVVQPLFQSHDTAFLGNVFLILATIGGVISTIYSRGVMKKYDPLVIVFWAFVIGSISFFPLMIRETMMHGFLTNLNMQGIIGITFGAGLSSLCAYYFSFWAIKYLLACETGVFTYIDPLIAIVIAIPLLHEYPSPVFIIGTLFVFLGIYIAEGRLQYHPINLFFSMKEIVLAAI